MNIQSDIKWIQEELMKVEEPELITALKSMLKYRQRQVENRSVFDLAYARAVKDKESGRTKAHTEVRKKYEKWL